MSDLTECMNPGVRPSRALHFDVTAEDFSRGTPDFAHDGTGILLLLPPAVPRTVVFD
jgi:hypothetical protein